MNETLGTAIKQCTAACRANAVETHQRELLKMSEMP
jgi:hypothetical protein